MTNTNFVISSFCHGGGCVAVAANADGTIRVTDSKRQPATDSPQLTFTADEWDAFTAGVRAGEFERDLLESHRAAHR